MPALYPVFEQSLPSAESFDGWSLSSDFGELDDIAARLGLATLSEFVDARSMALEVLEVDQLPANCPPVRWYTAQEGLATVQGLLLHLEKHSEMMPQSRTWITEDLTQLAILLHEAKNKNNKFHLMVDM